MTEPAPEPVSSTLDDRCPALQELDPEMRARVIAAAQEYLYRWTGGAFGLCEVTVRPCRSDCAERVYSTWSGRGPHPSGGGSFSPAVIRGQWFNLGCGSCGDVCGCGSLQSLTLPGKIHSITSVVIDGETLDPSAYRVDSFRYLVRQDGGSWPTCQDLGKPAGEEGTWEVTYLAGNPVPAGGQLAEETLTCELAKAFRGDRDCQLPKRVQTVTREGVTVAMLDSFDDVDQGHTGIWVIDSWLASIRHSPKAFTVRSPDVAPRVRRTTWDGP